MILRVSFWAFLIGILLLIFGVVGFANELWSLNINVPWWPIIAILIGLWVLSRAFRK